MKFILRSKVTVLAVALLAASTLAVAGTQKASASYIQDCKTNSIVRCGAGTPSDFIAKVKANTTGDLPKVFADFGLVTSEYSRFVTTAKAGTLYKSGGRIVVDGQTVATNAWSIGREQKSYSWAKTISGKTYYASNTKDVLLNDSLPVMVMFNSRGVMEFAVMNACGNPTTGLLVTPNYSCDLLQKTTVAGKKDTYSFTTKASAANNAKVVKVVYNFGDSTTATSTSLTSAVQHTYSKPGTYTTIATVYVSLPGSQTVTVTSVKCRTVIVVEQPKVEQPKAPYQACVSLTGVLLNKDERNYQFTVTTEQGNGSTLSNATFAFGDGVTAADLAPNSATTVMATHAYTKEGKYDITATVNFNTATGVESATCTTSVDTGTTPVTPPVCIYNPSLPPESPECVAPPEQVLPKTGTGSMIGLFMGTSLFAGLGYRWFAARRAIQS